MTAVEITAAEAARRCGLTQQAVGLWTKRPGAPVRIEGTRIWVQWPAFARFREAELVRQAVSESTPADLAAERTRKTRAEATMAELELAQRQGELVAIADYGTALGRVLDTLMAQLRALPVRLAHLGPPVEEAVENEVERIITELSQFDENVLDEPEPDEAGGMTDNSTKVTRFGNRAPHDTIATAVVDARGGR